MKNKLILFLMTLLCFFLQTTVIQKLAIGSIVPNLLIILVVSVGLMRGKKTALIVGFLAGLFQDLFYGDYLGIYAFLYMMVGYLSGFSYKIYFDNNIKVPMVLAAGGDLLYNAGVFVFLFLLRGKMNFLFYLKRILIPEFIYTVFFTLLVYKLFYYINHRLMKQDRKEGNAIWLLK